MFQRQCVVATLKEGSNPHNGQKLSREENNSHFFFFFVLFHDELIIFNIQSTVFSYFTHTRSLLKLSLKGKSIKNFRFEKLRLLK